MAARFAWGIDIGNRALKAVKLVRDGDNLRVDDFEVIEHETVLSNAGDNREALITSAIAQFVQRHPQKGGVAAIGVSGQASFARFIKLPPVETKKIPEIVRFEAIQQIPFPLDDVEWSYQLFQSPDSPDVEVGIFAMRKELVNQHIAHFTAVDMNVQAVQMNPLAVYNAMQFDQRISGTTMIIDLGAENTDLIIADENSIWLRSIPIGGNNFTEALVKSFKLNFPKAEDLKRNAATSKYARQIFQAMRPVFADLVAEVQRSIGFYASVHRDSRIKRILALGGTFKLPGLQKYLHQNLQLDVQRLDTVAAGQPTDPKVAASFNDNILSVVSAYGLALQAMGEGKITSSLLPQHIRRAKLWKEKTKFFGAAAALFLVGTGVAYSTYFLHSMGVESSRGVASANEGVLQQATSLDGKWNEISSAGATDRQRILNIRTLQNYRDLQTQILADLHRNIPQMKGTPDEIKKVQRSQRTQLFVDSLLTHYYPELSTVLAPGASLANFVEVPNATSAGFVPHNAGGSTGIVFDSASGGAGAVPGLAVPGTDGAGVIPGGAAPAVPGAEGAAAGGPAGRGFVITIRGTTPNGGGADFVEQTLIQGLKKISKANIPDGKPFYVANASVVLSQKVKDDANKVADLKTDYDTAVKAKESGTYTPPSGGGGGAFTGGGGVGRISDGGFVPGVGEGAGAAGGGAPVQVDDSKAFADRLTGESVLDDTAFTVVAVIVLDPPPKQPADAGAAAAPAQP